MHVIGLGYHGMIPPAAIHTVAFHTVYSDRVQMKGLGYHGMIPPAAIHTVAFHTVHSVAKLRMW
jgi:hypothetical protein